MGVTLENEMKSGGALYTAGLRVLTSTARRMLTSADVRDESVLEFIRGAKTILDAVKEAVTELDEAIQDISLTFAEEGEGTHNVQRGSVRMKVVRKVNRTVRGPALVEWWHDRMNRLSGIVEDETGSCREISDAKVELERMKNQPFKEKVAISLDIKTLKAIQSANPSLYNELTEFITAREGKPVITFINEETDENE